MESHLHSYSLRQLKAVLRVAELHNVTHASKTLRRSQTAVTKSIHEIEKQIGLSLFDRSPRGLTPNKYGQIFAKRLSTIKRILDQANEYYQTHHSRPRPASHIPIFSMDVSARRMATLVSLAKSGDVKIAASEMALTPSAIYKFVRELEAQLDLALFERRTGGRLRPTEFCEYLLSNISLIFAELRYALEDLQSLDGQIVGSVTIGTLPSTRSIIVPAALDKFIARYPNISVSTREASHRQMTSALAAGDLDMIITGTRPLSPQPGVTTTHLCDDTLHLVARSDHALFKRRKVRVEHLNDSRWVLPPKTTPARHVYEAIMKETGLSSDMACVESNSVVIMRSMVLNSDFIAITSAQQTQIERNAGAIAIVPFELSDDAWPIGVLTRNNTELSPAATAFFKMLKEAADELPN